MFDRRPRSRPVPKGAGSNPGARARRPLSPPTFRPFRLKLCIILTSESRPPPCAGYIRGVFHAASLGDARGERRIRAGRIADQVPAGPRGRTAVFALQVSRGTDNSPDNSPRLRLGPEFGAHLLPTRHSLTAHVPLPIRLYPTVRVRNCSGSRATACCRRAWRSIPRFRYPQSAATTR